MAELTLITDMTRSSPMFPVLEDWAESISVLSNGEHSVSILFAGSDFPESDLIFALSSGGVDLGFFSAPSFEADLPGASSLALPFFTLASVEANEVLNFMQPFSPRGEVFEAAGMTPLAAAFESEQVLVRGPFFEGLPVASFAVTDGLARFLFDRPEFEASFLQLPPAEWASALSVGVLTAAFVPITSIRMLGLDRPEFDISFARDDAPMLRDYKVLTLSNEAAASMPADLVSLLSSSTQTLGQQLAQHVLQLQFAERQILSTLENVDTLNAETSAIFSILAAESFIEEARNAPTSYESLATFQFILENSFGQFKNPDLVNIVLGSDQRSVEDQSERLDGGAFVDFILGFGGNDTIVAGPGDDRIDGGAGSDTVEFSNPQSNYTLTFLADGGVLVSDRAGRFEGDGTDILKGIEFLDFSENILGRPYELEQFTGIFDLTLDELDVFVELYIAYFNRAPDAIGLSFWASAFANGVSLEEAATLFIDQPEYRATYRDDLTNSEFATAVYDNVLGRIPDQAGFDFWVGALDSGGVGRDQFILAVLEGAKAEPPEDASADFVSQQLVDQKYLADKTELGTFFAIDRGLSNVDDALLVMNAFDGSQASLTASANLVEQLYESARQAEGGEFLIEFVGLGAGTGYDPGML